jgi:Relaxase/Mobilisation nuclease domain
MVARFPTPRKNVRRVVYYSENKVKEGTAEYICAVNFHKEIDEMTADEKVQFFLQRNLLRPSCKANTPHIVLGFHPSERLSIEQFAVIAQDFMERIDFGEQPFLVYYHTDTHSPHLHIVTTLIRADGSRIDPHNIGKEKCLPACQALEEKYHLIKAKGRRITADQAATPPVPRKLKYGESETYKSLSDTLQAVIKGYIFTTVGELNAILREYNVLAETGKPGTKTEKNKGLYYRVLDDQGKPKGVPIKASELPGKPTLRRLKEIFERNRELQAKNIQSVRTRISWALYQRPKNLHDFIEILGREGIKTILWKNDVGWIYGVTFFDLRTKTAINGRSLGNDMGIAGLQANWTRKHRSSSPGGPISNSDSTANISDVGPHSGSFAPHPADESGMAQLIEILLQPVQQDDRVPYEFSAKKNRKRHRPTNS